MHKFGIFIIRLIVIIIITFLSFSKYRWDKMSSFILYHLNVHGIEKEENYKRFMG